MANNLSEGTPQRRSADKIESWADLDSAYVDAWRVRDLLEALRVAKNSMLPFLSDQRAALRYVPPLQWAAFGNVPYDSVFQLVIHVGELVVDESEKPADQRNLPSPLPLAVDWEWLKEALGSEALQIAGECGTNGEISDEVRSACDAGKRLIELVATEISRPAKQKPDSDEDAALKQEIRNALKRLGGMDAKKNSIVKEVGGNRQKVLRLIDEVRREDVQVPSSGTGNQANG